MHSVLKGPDENKSPNVCVCEGERERGSVCVGVGFPSSLSALASVASSEPLELPERTDDALHEPAAG